MKKLLMLTAVILFAVASSASADLVAYWNFDEGTGTVVNDSTGKSYAGTIHMLGTGDEVMPTHVTTPWGYGMDQHSAGDGTAQVMTTWMDYVAASDQCTLSFRTNGYGSQLLNTSYLFNVNTNAQPPMSVAYVGSSSKIYFRAGHGKDASGSGHGWDQLLTVVSSDKVSGQWNNWVMVKDGVNAEMKLYINGVLLDSMSGCIYNDLGLGNEKFDWFKGTNIGSSNWNSRARGIIDEVRIFDHAISQATVTELYLHNTPEPITVMLLGLGGLFLRRRK